MNSQQKTKARRRRAKLKADDAIDKILAGAKELAKAQQIFAGRQTKEDIFEVGFLAGTLQGAALDKLSAKPEPKSGIKDFISGVEVGLTVCKRITSG